MTNGQKLALRCSEIRQRLNEISGLEDDAFTDEVRQESDKLGTEYRDTETKYRAALVSEGDASLTAGSQFLAGGSAEDRAYRELVGRADVGAIFAAAVEHRATAGAEAEIQRHHELHSHQVPLDLLRGPAVEEHRAVTEAPTNVGASQEPTLTPVFAMGDAAFLGVDMPSVPAGDAVYPVLTTRPTIRGPFTDGSDAAETDGTFLSTNLSPGRIQAAFSYLRTDAARFGGMGETLRMALNEGLSEGVDQQIVNGTSGLLNGANLTNHNAAASVTTFDEYIERFGFGRVDGRYAARRSDLRVLLGSATYAHAGSAYRANQTETSALDRLMAIIADVKVSAHVPAVGATKKQNNVIRLGMRRDMVAPMWEGVTIIVSETDEALVKKGTILITAILIHAIKILRADGFYKQEVRHTT